MNHNKKILFGSIVAIVAIATIMSVGVADTLTVNNIDKNCMSAEESKKVSTFHKIPTQFVGNYSLRCIAIGHPYEVSMIISDKPVTSTEWLRESVNPSGDWIFLNQVDEGKYLSAADRAELGNAEKRIRDTIAEINEKNPAIHARYFDINGMPAYGTESCANCGTQTANFADGSVIEQKYDVPSKLKIISDDGVRYSFYGNVPLDDLITVAKSLQ